MTETIIVAGIVVFVIFLTGRHLYRTWTGKSRSCGCTGGCGTCPEDPSKSLREKTDSG